MRDGEMGKMLELYIGYHTNNPPLPTTTNKLQSYRALYSTLMIYLPCILNENDNEANQVTLTLTFDLGHGKLPDVLHTVIYHWSKPYRILLVTQQGQIKIDTTSH